MKFLGKIIFACCLFTASQANSQVILVDYSSNWSYYDNANEPSNNNGSDWNDINYNSSSWSQGNAQLGYGDSDENTVINSNTKTAYFRYSFTVSDPGAYDGVDLNLIYDDGAVVYLNGNEVWRVNMPNGTIDYSTFSTTSSTDNANANTAISNSLVTGENIIAVEVHQVSNSSSDISFDLKAEATIPGSVSISRGPYLQKASASSITVRWRTATATQTIVKYGTDINNLNLTYTNTTPKTEHIAQLDALSPNTTYYYRLENSAAIILPESNDIYFKTHPNTGTEQPITMWILGDCGTANNDQRAVRDAYYSYIGNNHTDGILFLGDNAYNDGTDAQYQNAIFSNMYEDKLQNSVAWSCLGNHDGYSTNSNNQTGPYYDIFSFPTAGESGGVASGTEAYYSFDYGNIHFIALESYQTDRSVGGAMYNWALSDIQNTTQDWIVAYWHHPPYTKGSHDSDSESNLIDMRQNFLPMLESNGVDLVLSGHSHSYERSYFLNGHYGNSNTFNSSTHTVGANGDGNGQQGGNGAYNKTITGADAGEGAVYITTGSSGKISSGSLNHQAMFYSVSQLGSCVLEVNGNQLDVKFVRETGSVDDYFTIIKEEDCVVGTSCDDADACTTNDTYDSNCNCIGTDLPDTDNDGICDAEDQCPTLDDALIGTACDDGNNQTENDIYGNDCNCAGVPCSPAGTTCDDGDPSTYNDITDGSCNCAGTPCPAAGTSCDDGDPATSNDIEDGNCNCAGQNISTTTCITINSGSDDVEENESNGSMYSNSSDIELVFDTYQSAGNQTIGLRFNAVDVPQGATISNAYIQFTVDETNTGTSNLTIVGEDVDNASAFSTSAYNITNRTKTSASVSWSPPNWTSVGDQTPDQQTADISSIIQEIVNRPGYSINNSMVIVITGTGERTAESYNGSASQAPQLCIEYSDCPNQGASCNDGDPCTTNDIIDGSCNCTGTFQDADGDGVCDADDLCPGGDDNIDSDNDGTPDFCDSCDNNTIGNSCNDGDDCTVNDVIDANCNCAGTYQDTDSDGICDGDDQEINSPCPLDVNASGVSNDDDNDGIPNCNDPCDDNVDTDADGVSDCVDQEINSPCPLDVNANGVSNDDDNDGIPNCNDPCNNNIDSDGDGVDDCVDQEINSPCPLDVNASGVSNDDDNDGIPNCNDTCDNNIDTDGDGVDDCVDQEINSPCPLDVNASGVSNDDDNDGIPNCNDPCDDNVDTDADGVSDCVDQEINSPCPLDVNANGVSNDDDNDGIPNCNDPCNNNIDTDGDGVDDCVDQEINSPCPLDVNASGVSNDDDNDGIPNCNDTCDNNIDTDGDGVDDCVDQEINSPCPLDVNASGVSNDDDNDGIPNCNDPCDDNVDTDADGVSDCVDQEINSPCPLDVNANGVSNDDDNDGIPNCNDPCNNNIDTDGDGVDDCVDQEINSPCPLDVNASGVSNDDDNDGIPNCNDTCDNNIDTDGDGVDDCVDQEINSPCPLDVNASGVSNDDDNDGIPNCNDPCDDNVDTDADGVSDCVDQEINSPCPLDVNANGVSNDDDNDGIPNCNDPCNNNLDTDGDGVDDCVDQEINSPCPLDVNASGVSNDDDNDGIPNCNDTCDDNIDTDGDGVDDCVDQEINSPCPLDVNASGVSNDDDNDGIPNCNDPCDDNVDTDADGVSDCVDQEINSPCPADVNASGVSNDDDNDGIPNCNDPCNNNIDSDGDGIDDCVDQEINSPCPLDVNTSGVSNDDDNDGIPNCNDTCDNNIDTDGDGVDDCVDQEINSPCPLDVNASGVSNDDDNDGIPNCNDPCDDNLDTDADGVSDCVDQEINSPCPLDVNASGVSNDEDNDGIPNCNDPCNNNIDTDGDGVDDCVDQEINSPCPLDVNASGVSNDDDNDGIPNCNDTCDNNIDTDGDGVDDCIDQEINSPCPLDVNASGVSNDDDNDGIPNCNDPCDDNADTDADGVSDCVDQEINSPCPADVNASGVSNDDDNDGIPNCNDPCNNNIDSDGDGVDDCVDQEINSPCPLDVNASGVSNDDDNDGIPNCNDTCDNNIDTDGDGVDDCVDQEINSPCPLDVNASGVSNDDDNDGIPNCNDPCDDNVDTDADGVSDCVDQEINSPCPLDVNASGVSNDDDNDGIPNCNDPCNNNIDTDGDGVDDCVDQEINSPCPLDVNASGVSNDDDNDGIPNCNDTCDNNIDTDGDGVDDCIDQEINSPCPLDVNASGVSNDDDNDGIPNCNDPCDNNIDSDGDGVDDCVDQEINSPCPQDVNASGVSNDSDNDGIPNCNDTCDNNTTGNSCDDGDPSTYNDIIDANCNCIGTPCPTAGTACDDGDPSTENDIEDGNCNCAGENINTITTCITINSGSDDVEENEVNGSMYMFSSDLELVYDTYQSAGNQTIGLRFNSVDVPQGASISNAYIQFTVDEANTGVSNLTIVGQAVDNASGFSTTAYDVTNRVKTNASVAWSPSDWITVGDQTADQQTVDISAIIQEIVNRPGYALNNSMVLVITGTGERTAESYDGSPAQAPQLCIEYIDDCPTQGASCDDGDPCTTNDIIDAACNCTGTFQDNDSDGFCVGDDPDDNDACNPDDSAPECAPCDELSSDGFESNYGAWNDGGGDCTRRKQYPNTGIFSVRLRDNSGISSSMYTNALNLSSYSEVSIEFSYYPNSMENGEDFFLEISTNNGNNYLIYRTWERGVDFNNSVRYDEVVTIDDVTFTSQTVLRIRCDASGNGDQIYIDDVIVTGCDFANAINEIIIDQFGKIVNEDVRTTNINSDNDPITLDPYEFENDEDSLFEDQNEEEEFSIYPNPTRNFVFVEGNWGQTSKKIEMLDIYGQKVLVKSIELRGNQVIKLDISTVPSGIYILNLLDSNELISSKRVIVTNQ